MRNDKKSYVVETILLVALVAAASISAHDQPPVQVIYEGCCDDCQKNCTAHGETAVACEAKCSAAKCDNQNTNGAAVVVEVVVQGGTSSGGATTSSTSVDSSSSTSKNVNNYKKEIPSMSTQTNQETHTKAKPTPPTSTPAKAPIKPSPAKPTPAEPSKAKSPTKPTPSSPTPSKTTSSTPTSSTPTPSKATQDKSEKVEPKKAESTKGEPKESKHEKAQQVTTQKSAKVEKDVKALCQGAMYKDACNSVLVNGAKTKGSTEEVIKSGASVALERVTKVFNLTDTLVPMVKDAKKPETAQLAVDDCKEMFQVAKEKLNQFLKEFHDRKSFATPCEVFKFRLRLSDVVTFTETCMDSLGEAEAPELQNVLKGGVVNATEVTMSILDVFTGLTRALKSNEGELDPAKITDALKNLGVGGEKAGSQRRLLEGPSEMIGDDGIPRWLSESDRELLDLDHRRKERNLAGIVPNAVVALDGSGQFRSLKDAIKAYDPMKIKLPPGAKYVIYVKAGIYKEYVLIGSEKPNIFIYGDGPTRTIISGNKSNKGGVPTSQTATFVAQSANFFAKDMAFENAAGPQGLQAVALRANNVEQVYLNCHFNGFQDTLYVQGGSQFFRDCLMAGTIDFIFGNGATFIQRSLIAIRMPLLNQFNAITAQGRTGQCMPTGLVLQGCTFVAGPGLDKVRIKTYLGRPWKAFAKTVFLENNYADFITPEGFVPWEGTPNIQKSFFGEFANIGPSANTAGRVKWPGTKVLQPPEAVPFTLGTFMPGADRWLNAAPVPFYLGFNKP